MNIRRLNYRHLFYFRMVAREQHLTRAAKHLHVSQSALSMQIRKLEEQLGRALFTREGKKLVLTETGRLVLDYAEGIFALGEELMETLASGASAGVEQLRVGAVATLSRNFQDNFLSPVLAMDDVRLVLESGGMDELLERLRVHKLDLVLSNRPAVADAEDAWRCRRIDRQRVCLLGPPRRGRRPFRFPEDVAGVRLLLPGPGSDIRSQFDVLCEDLSITPNVFAEADDMAMLRLLARDSGGVAVIPEVVVQDEIHAGVLEKYCTVLGVHENFYAITTRRHFTGHALARLLDRS